MKKIGIGLIGAGLMGAAHSMMLRQLAGMKDHDIEMVVAADPDASKIAGFAKGFGYREHSTNPMDAINHPDVTAVYIATPTRYHLDYVSAAAKAGKHVFCEKPLAFTAADARAMLDLCEKAGVLHQVGLVMRFTPVFNKIKELVAGDLGFPMTTIFRDDQVFPIKGVHNTAWRGNLEEAGGGTIIEHSIHDVDMLMWLFGPIATVDASLSYLAGKNGIEDRAIVGLGFKSGMTATLISLWHDVERRPSNRLVEIFYEKGFITTDDEFAGTVKIQFGNGVLKTLPRDDVTKVYLEKIQLEKTKADAIAQSPYGFEDLEFIRAISEGRKPNPGFEVAIAAHEVVDAIYKSSSEKKIVKF